MAFEEKKNQDVTSSYDSRVFKNIMHYCSIGYQRNIVQDRNLFGFACYLRGLEKYPKKIHKIGIDSIIRLLFFFLSFFFACISLNN